MTSIISLRKSASAPFSISAIRSTLSIVMVRSPRLRLVFATRANLDSDHDPLPPQPPLWTIWGKRLRAASLSSRPTGCFPRNAATSPPTPRPGTRAGPRPKTWIASAGFTAGPEHKPATLPQPEAKPSQRSAPDRGVVPVSSGSGEHIHTGTVRIAEQGGQRAGGTRVHTSITTDVLNQT